MTNNTFPTTKLDPAFDDSLFRQRERTVDNIKRVYAIVYSISFANVLREIVFYYEHHAIDRPEHFTSGLWLRLIMMFVFTTTISVFAFQADKFLDLRYALRPEGSAPKIMPRWRRTDFALEAIGLIFSLVPFVLMSYAFDNAIISRSGIVPFILAYLLLFGLSLSFLLLIRLRYLWKMRGSLSKMGSVLSEDERYGLLSVHWFATNGLLALFIVVCFIFLVTPSQICSATPPSLPAWAFVLLFSLAALGRNVWDYWSVWPFLYTNSRRIDDQDLTPLMKIIRRSTPEALRRWDLLGPVALLVIFYAFYLLGPSLSSSGCGA